MPSGYYNGDRYDEWKGIGVMLTEWIDRAVKRKMGKLLFLGAILLLSGCATLSNVKNARGGGHSRIYNVTYQKVWEAVPRAISVLGPSIVSINEKEGKILAETPVFQFASYGEVIAVFVEKIDETHTEVEVVSRKRMATNIFAYSYQDRILNELSKQLGTEEK